MGLYAALADAITAYTGLSPAAFFTVAALAVGVFRLVSGLFVAPDATPTPERRPPPAEPPAAPVQLGEVTLEELRAFDGSDPKKPLLMAIKGQIYDVSVSRMFYGPGGPYALFAGHDATRALALMSFDPKDLTSNVDGLRASELEVLQDWEYKFMEKYVKVGHIVSEKTTKGEDSPINDKLEGDAELCEKDADSDVITKDRALNSGSHPQVSDPDVITKGTEGALHSELDQKDSDPNVDAGQN